MVFTSDRNGGGQDIFCVSAEGGEPVALTELKGWADSPVFSPDGQRIAFTSNEAGNHDVWVMDADGSNRTQVTVDEGSDKHVRWAPDGKGLYFSSDRADGDADIWYMDLATRSAHQLNEDFGADITPVPSPDGSLIAFCSNRQLRGDASDPHRDRDKDIWMMRADGSLAVRLTSNQGADYSPCWSPDGKHLLYTANDASNVCHLRMVDVSKLCAAYREGDPEAVKKAANSLRHTKVDYERTEMAAEIGAARHTIYFTSWMPDSWVRRMYPTGYFGKERNPHWV